MTAAWPIALPQAALINGESETWLDQFIETNMSGGFPPKRRRRFSGFMSDIDVQMVLTETQLLALKSFYNSDLAGGALPFSWTIPSTGESANFIFVSNGVSHKPLTPTLVMGTFKLRVDP